MTMIITVIILLVTLFVILAPSFKYVGDFLYKIIDRIKGENEE